MHRTRDDDAARTASTSSDIICSSSLVASETALEVRAAKSCRSDAGCCSFAGGNLRRFAVQLHARNANTQDTGTHTAHG